MTNSRCLFDRWKLLRYNSRMIARSILDCECETCKSATRAALHSSNKRPKDAVELERWKILTTTPSIPGRDDG